MKKILIGIIIAILSSTIFIGCTSQIQTQEPPKLTITIGEEKLQYVTAKNRWNGELFDMQNAFKNILKEGSKIEPPYIEFGELAVITFENNPPDKFTISDILLDIKGAKKFFTPIISIPFELKDGKCSFEIVKNIETGLDSYWAPNMTYFRGFKMTASWGENQCEYDFIIKTAR